MQATVFLPGIALLQSCGNGRDIGKVAGNSPYAAMAQKRWLAEGGTLESLAEAIRPIDPAAYAQNLRGRRVSMVNARYDELIPS